MAKVKQAPEDLEQPEAGIGVQEPNEPQECPMGATKKKEEIPASVDKILKLFPEYEKLYVDEKGGVYTSETALPQTHIARLYTNPYFNL